MSHFADDETIALIMRLQKELKKQLAEIKNDSIEMHCLRCNVIHPRNGCELIQYCPDCKTMMIVTSFNQRAIKRLKAEIAARDLVIEQMRAGFQTFIDEHEECEDAGGWLASLCSQEAVHVADECLALQPSAEALAARDRKRDAALLRAVVDNDEFYHYSLHELATMRESGEWELEL